jgi:hypothetical protein
MKREKREAGVAPPGKKPMQLRITSIDLKKTCKMPDQND